MLQFLCSAPCRGMRQTGSSSDTPSPSPALHQRGQKDVQVLRTVEEAALPAFPFCSLRSWGSTQAKARFSSWIHMKHLSADCSLPSCLASCHGSGSRTHTHTRGTEKPNQYAAGRAGNTMRAKQRAGLYLRRSQWHSLLVFGAGFLFSRAS